jgi:hypothetical protein
MRAHERLTTADGVQGFTLVYAVADRDEVEGTASSPRRRRRRRPLDDLPAEGCHLLTEAAALPVRLRLGMTLTHAHRSKVSVSVSVSRARATSPPNAISQRLFPTPFPSVSGESAIDRERLWPSLVARARARPLSL